MAFIDLTKAANKPLVPGTIIASETEEEIFKILGELPWKFSAGCGDIFAISTYHKMVLTSP
jgi:hypothetical protein